ncbi:hypothetical protein DPMN_083488 [Dreissena polymorpha]|uniref:Uncharacterized protein n=1 Tax=Dreissena polymorpha TaxID=45954 RepID=A0A9D4BHR6_DREPO|nr:hypothetical protein DPMN_083488 [Dreissena polymorpha]
MGSFFSTVKSPNLLMRSTGLIRCMKAWKRSLCYYLHVSCICLIKKIISMVDLPPSLSLSLSLSLRGIRTVTQGTFYQQASEVCKGRHVQN